MTKLSTIFGYGFGIGAELVLTITFLVAYFSPSKSVPVTVNSFGEANIEFVFIFAILTISIIGFWKMIRGLKPV